MDKVFLLISVILYVIAPEEFSSGFCWMLFLLFLGEAAYLYIRDFKYEKIGFNILFTLAFFLVTYMYPIFIEPFFPNFQILSIPLFNYDWVSKGTALANVAYACYASGYAYILNKTEKKEEKNKEDITTENEEIKLDKATEEDNAETDSLRTGNVDAPYEPTFLLYDKKLNLFTLFTILFFGLFVALGGMQVFKSMYGGGEAQVSGVTHFVWMLEQSMLVILMICNLRVNNKFVYFVLGFIILLLLAVGTRTVPLNLVVPAIYFYCKQKNLSFGKIALFGSIFVILFAALGILRGGDSAMDAAGGDAVAQKFRSLMDFIIPNRDLYAIYDHTERDGYTYGISSLGYILNVVPFVQGLFVKLTGIPDYMLASERLTTYWEFGDVEDAWGLGTNIVGDVYLSFGIIGVILHFIFLGYVIAKCRQAYLDGSEKGYLLYMVMVAGVIFMCRGAFFYALKNIVWAFVIIKVFNWLYSYRSTD